MCFEDTIAAHGVRAAIEHRGIHRVECRFGPIPILKIDEYKTAPFSFLHLLVDSPYIRIRYEARFHMSTQKIDATIGNLPSINGETQKLELVVGNKHTVA